MNALKRFKVASKYLRLSRLKSAFGLLTSETRADWIQTIPVKALNKMSDVEILPWYSFGAIEFLLNNINPSMKILELGSGSSTIWWAMNVSQVTSLERDRNWCNKVKLAIESRAYNNITLIHSTLNLPECENNTELENIENSFELAREYLRVIDLSSNAFDVVIVDDVLRSDSCISLISSINSNGMLVLDDSERIEYQRAIKKIEELGWTGHHFYGPAPYHFHEKQTSIWVKPV